MDEDKVPVDSSGLLKMESYMKEQGIFIVENYFKNNKRLSATIFVRNIEGIVI